ncbi:Repressor ROX1 [Psilocybe cubensis]|uniref:Repressor ROX1 n=1 Tax=Psilocybe cubensis TaxID=181762 RepID=A0ACB8HDE8_PSICU|nr:Repressor ROX1 [Psilocybe cubensis]KAH9485818.1 Repressor ROX1 [Psilocybe cubensis]
MSLDQDQKVDIEDVEEDDMPPLVDDSNPNYTFFSGMTPLSFTSTSAPTASQDSNPQPSRSLVSSLPASPITPDESTSSFSMSMSQPRPHGKRRDPSYIPRPPNAFILFRCAFIKEQNVPGKVEGNHSRLSKIIGLCWKQLSPEEREKWEAKAVIAQAEHRAHYPDWRFRPGANALAKLKIQDGTSSVTSRRRSVRSRAGKTSASPEVDDDDGVALADTKGKGKEKGRAKAKSSRMLSMEETRCAKIAGFVAEGIRGQELEVAVKEWEGDHKIPKANPRVVKPKGRASQGSTAGPSRKKSSSTTTGVQVSTKHSPSNSPEIPSFTPNPWTPESDTGAQSTLEPLPSKTLTTDAAGNGVLSSVPLTHMFKRALSAPLADVPLQDQYSPGQSNVSSAGNSPSSAEPSPNVQWRSFRSPMSQELTPRTHNHSRRDTISIPLQPNSSVEMSHPQQLTWQEAENQRRIEELRGPDSWWPQRSSSDSSQLSFSNRVHCQPQTVSARLNDDGMGYDASQGTNQFDRGYLERLGQYERVPDESQQVEWRHLNPDTNRQGLVALIEDPYKDDCVDPSSASSNSIPTLSLPSLSNSNYYHSPISPQSPTTVPSSSFSTLTGWAGEFRNNNMDMKPWLTDPETNHPSRSWYSGESSLSMVTGRPDLHRPQLAIDPDDWDRIEYRTASDLHLSVEPPPRQLDFIGELRRAQGGAA